MIVAGKLMLKGWMVYRSCSHVGACDLIAFKGLRVRYLEVRLGHLDRKGKVRFHKTINKGAPAPTEIAVYVPGNGSVLFYKL